MNTIELLEAIKEGKVLPDEETRIIKALLKQATENAISMSKFVLDNPKYFSEDGIRRAKEYLKEHESTRTGQTKAGTR